MGLEGAGEGLEDLVADAVAPGIIDLFEVIEVGEDDAEAVAGAVVELVELALDSGVEVSAVGQAREGVGLGQGAEVSAGHFQLGGGGGIAEEGDGALASAVGVEQGEDLDLEDQGAAGLVVAEEASDAGSAGVQSAKDRAGREVAGAAGGVAEGAVVAGSTGELFGRVAGDGFRAAAPVDDPATGIDDAEALGELIEEPEQGIGIEGRNPTGIVGRP